MKKEAVFSKPLLAVAAAGSSAAVPPSLHTRTKHSFSLYYKCSHHTPKLEVTKKIPSPFFW